MAARRRSRGRTPRRPDPYLIYRDLNDTIRPQVKLNEPISKITDTNKMGQLMEQIEGQLEPDARKRVEALLPKIHPAAFLIDAAEYRDLDLEAQMAKQVRGFKGVTVIPEPFGPGGLSEDLKKVIADPAARPRSDAEKKATAKLAATWLSKIAQGALPGTPFPTPPRRTCEPPSRPMTWPRN